MKKLTFTLLSTLILSACSSAPKLTAEEQESCLDNHSKAWCIMELAGLAQGLEDVKPEQAQAYLAKHNVKMDQVSGSGGADKGYLTLAGLEALHGTSVFGLASGIPSVVFLFSSLSDNRPSGQRPQSFIMLKESDVKNGSPEETAKKIIEDAIFKTFEVDQKRTFFTKRGHANIYNMFGGKCGEVGCVYQMPYFGYDQPHPKFLTKFIEKGPNWMGSQKIYIWKNGTGMLEINGVKQLRWADKPYQEFKQNIKKDFWFNFIPGEVPMLTNGDQVMLAVH